MPMVLTWSRMALRSAKGDSSTEEVEQVPTDDEEDEEEQALGAKRARVAVVGDKADQERRGVQEELEFHAKAWRLTHLGERGDSELQPSGREREAEMPGDHTTSVGSSGQHIMADGTESESLTGLAASEVDGKGRKLVYSSARMVVRLEPTPGYKHPVSDDSVRVEDGAPEGVVVAYRVPRYLSCGYETGPIDHTKGGHTVTEVTITMQHTHFEHHLMERVDALSSKMADFIKLYHELKLQSSEASENLAAIEGQVGIGKQREKELATERSRYLDEREELNSKDRLQAANEAKTKAPYAEGAALQGQAPGNAAGRSLLRPALPPPAPAPAMASTKSARNLHIRARRNRGEQGPCSPSRRVRRHADDTTLTRSPRRDTFSLTASNEAMNEAKYEEFEGPEGRATALAPRD